MVRIKHVASLNDWYSSEDGKRSLGGICQKINEDGTWVTLMGSPDSPLLILKDAEAVPEGPNDVKITIERAKADWSAVTTAAALLGTRFRIQGKKLERAVLYKYPGARHPAEQYRRSSSVDANTLAEKIEKIANDVRKLGLKLQRLSASVTVDICRICNQLERSIDIVDQRIARSADLIDRRFREAWRCEQGYPVRPSPLE